MNKYFESIKKKYGVSIVYDFFDNGKMYYMMYSADGCLWENGLSYRGIQREIKDWGKSLIKIKSSCDKKRI